MLITHSTERSPPLSANQDDRQANARKKAQKHFNSPDERDADLRQERDNQRARFDAKGARLRALRLEKEALDNQSAAAPEAAPEAKKTRTRRVKRITL
ncbi:MAG TPA: hypothetical protein VFW28_18035 [Micropepsaceae bacterium]|nr:hypothetical protein [Micropepsaceae bacterium]